MPLKISINNIGNLTKEIAAYPKDIEKIINNELKAFAVETANMAKQLAPVNEGALRESINFTAEDLLVHVGAYIEYAAFLEFGTKQFAEAYVATLPEDWQEFAAEHRGPTGGTFLELIQAIMKWVELKGIASGNDIKQASYLIARKIVTQGIRAQPFLYPAFEFTKLQLIDNLKAQLNVK